MQVLDEQIDFLIDKLQYQKLEGQTVLREIVREWIRSIEETPLGPPYEFCDCKSCEYERREQKRKAQFGT